jgi:Spy/CpxP family protein refolding chaperone
MTTNKNKTIILVMIVLLITNAVFTSILWFKSQNKHRVPPNHGRGKFLMEQLDFDSAQRRQFKAIKSDYFNRLDDLIEKEHQFKNDFFQLLQSENVSNEAILSKAKQTADLKLQIDTMMMNHFLKIKSICNKDQVEALYKFVDNFNKQPFPFPRRRTLQNQQDSFVSTQQAVDSSADLSIPTQSAPMNRGNNRPKHRMPPPEFMEEFNRDKNPDFHRPPHPRPPRREYEKGNRDDFPDGPPPPGPPPME